MPQPAADQPVFEVVSPVGEESAADDAAGSKGRITPAAPLEDFSGKRIGLVWSAFRNGNVYLDATQALLSKRFPGVEFVRLPGGAGLEWGDRPHESIGELGRKAGIDAAIAAAAG